MINIADTNEFQSKNYESDFKLILLDDEISELGLSEEKLRDKFLEYNEIYINAIWNGQVTNQFKNWLKGKKIYEREKERISLYLPEKQKESWRHYVNMNDQISSLSKLIRESVEFYISNYQSLSTLDKERKNFEKDVALKQSLTVIKGVLDFLIKEHSEELNEKVLNMIQDAFNESTTIEKKLTSNNQQEGDVDLFCIDDNKPTLKLIKLISEAKGYSFRGVENGITALEVLSKITPKLILLDILLPDISGWEICNKIKSNKNLKNIPLYVVSSINPKIIRDEISKTEADGYILKPFELTELIQLLEKYCKKRKNNVKIK